MIGFVLKERKEDSIKTLIKIVFCWEVRLGREFTKTIVDDLE